MVLISISSQQRVEQNIWYWKSTDVSCSQNPRIEHWLAPQQQEPDSRHGCAKPMLLGMHWKKAKCVTLWWRRAVLLCITWMCMCNHQGDHEENLYKKVTSLFQRQRAIMHNVFHEDPSSILWTTNNYTTQREKRKESKCITTKHHIT